MGSRCETVTWPSIRLTNGEPIVVEGTSGDLGKFDISGHRWSDRTADEVNGIGLTAIPFS